MVIYNTAVDAADAEVGRLLRVRDVARRLTVHPNTVRAWIHTGKLDAVRWPNGHFRVPEAAVRALLGAS